MPPKKRKKRKKKARNDNRGFVTASTAKKESVTENVASVSAPKSPTDIDSGQVEQSVSNDQDFATSKCNSELAKSKNKPNVLDWITELPNHYLPYLKKSKASSTKKELPVVSFMLDGALESEIYDFTMKRGCKLAVVKEKVSFKSLNYAYLTLEKTGFNRIDTENILRNNLGNHVTTMFWWACLNIDHDKLPAGFVDKSEHALKTSKISVVYRKNMDGAGSVAHSASTNLLNAFTKNEMVIKKTTDRGLEAESGKQKENPSQPDGHISNVTDITSNDTVLNAMSWMYDSDSSGDDSTV